MKHQKLYSQRIQLLVVLAGLACNSTYNTVKLHSARDGQKAYTRLLTTHYVSAGGNLVMEYDRGERSAEFELQKAVSQTNQPRLRVKLTVYFDDPPLNTNAEIEVGKERLPLLLTDLQREKKEELATVLDTGQRSEFMPPMGNDVQAQSGYITFGKPAGAGTAKRHWIVYTFSTHLPENMHELLFGQKAIAFIFSLGGHPATTVVDGKERAAWMRFFEGKIDAQAEN